MTTGQEYSTGDETGDDAVLLDYNDHDLTDRAYSQYDRDGYIRGNDGRDSSDDEHSLNGTYILEYMHQPSTHGGPPTVLSRRQDEDSF